VIADCLAEVERLEKVFSLYRADSEISRLNQNGRLIAPSHDMRSLLTASRSLSELTEGLYDPTVQPVWELYADWFAANIDKGGPPAASIRRALASVGYKRLVVRPDLVSLPTGGRLTLNGIAQGYITDKVANLLRNRGWAHVLVNMGELRALDAKPDGRPWDIKLAGSGAELPLDNKAMATSAGAALRFDGDGQYSHIIDPRSGLSPRHWRAVTVSHGSATVADALSTGVCSASPEAIGRVVQRLAGLQVWATNLEGKTKVLAT